MIKHTAVFSDGTVVERNFKRHLPYGVRSVNTQTRRDGSTLVQTSVGFSSSKAAKSRFRQMTGTTVTEVVPATHSEL